MLDEGTTGFFGIPGRVPRDGHNVHYVVNGKPICGTHIHPSAEFQFCGHGLHFDMLECEKCIQIVKNMKTRTLKWFDSLGRRDFENQAVLDEIRAVFKERDQLYAELHTPGPKESHRAAVARRRETGGHWG